jgi:anti-sigma regulatory factor (Ser/Thr protein kinase)
MIDLIFNAIKFAVSADARKSAADLIATIRRSPEWQKETCSLSARIPLVLAEQADFVIEVLKPKLKSLNYTDNAVDEAITLLHELMRNAFEYGCSAPRDKIDLHVDITPAYLSIVVNNSKRHPFDFIAALAKARKKMAAPSTAKRGRGLIRITEVADVVMPTPNQQGVKAVFYRERVRLEVSVEQGVVFIALTGGFYNPSLQRRLLALAANYRDLDIVLDLRGWSFLTTVETLC